MKSLFVTGTDTGVGKTVLTAALIAAARAAGGDVVPMKPVQTGCDTGPEGDLMSPDLDLILARTGIVASRDHQALMCPYRYGDACSPHLAAVRENRPVCVDTIVAAYRSLSALFDAVVVEGAGGLLVPLNDRQTMRDLVKALGLEVIVAARPGLGTLNHTLLTIESLQAGGLFVRAVVIVQSRPEPLGFIEHDNMETLRQRCGVPVLGPLPYMPDIGDPAFTPEQFGAIVRPVLSSI